MMNMMGRQECCKQRVLLEKQQSLLLVDENANETPSMMLYSMENPPKLSAEKRRDHLHLLRRRKSRARFLNQEEQIKLINFRRFFISGHVGFADFILRVRAVREAEQRETYDENGVPSSEINSR